MTSLFLREFKIQKSTQKLAGLGDAHFIFAIYIANRPPCAPYENLKTLRSLKSGEISSIVERSGNHWRKIFNVYAKLRFTQVGSANFPKWQTYRDEQLLQEHGGEALLFSPPDFSCHKCVHIVAGKTHARQLGLLDKVQWLDASFAVNRDRALIVSPYLDYRQLSNDKVEQLAKLVKEFL